METFPEQVFQNHMIHHPLLQYQMLFPSLLMSLGAPPSERGDEEELFMEGDGKINSMDYLRFSALANQLAITQINQVLMDIVKEPEGGDSRGLLELQKSILENGFTQMNRHMTENRAFARNNNDIVKKLDLAVEILHDTVAKGFLNTISEMIEIQGTMKSNSNQTVSHAKEFKGMLQSIANKVEELQFAEPNVTYIPMNCNQNTATESQKNTNTDDQDTEDSPTSKEILLQIQSDLRNLTNALENFIASNVEAIAARNELKALVENCTKSSPEPPVIDVSNITRTIEEGLADNLKEIKPHVQNLTNEIEEFDNSLLQVRDDLRELKKDLAANVSTSKEDLQILQKMTEMGFAEIHTKLDSLSNMSVTPRTTEVSHNCCPDEFFPVSEDCYMIVTGMPTSFKEAEEHCESLDAFLAEPEYLLKFILHVRNLEYNESLGLWLGGKEEKDPQHAGAESVHFKNPVWTWKTSGVKIDHGWSLGYPLTSMPVSCPFFYENGIQNGNCIEEKDFICEIKQECKDSAASAFVVPDSN